MPLKINTFCPICGNVVVLQTQTDRECDGYDGPCYDQDFLTGDPDLDVLVGCACDLNEPIMKRWAEWINDYHIYDYADMMNTPKDEVVLGAYEIGALQRLRLIIGSDIFPKKMQVVLDAMFKKLPEEYNRVYDDATDMEMQMVYGDAYNEP